MKSAVLALFLLSACFSDENSPGSPGSGSASGTETCSTGCAESGGTTGASDATSIGPTGGTAVSATGGATGGATSMDISDTEIGETTGITDGSTGTQGATSMVTATDTEGAMPCAVSNDCEPFEVCSAGLGECIDADAAIYEVTIVEVIIATPSQKYGDPDEVDGLDLYVRATVGVVVEHESQPVFTDPAQMTGYSFLADLNITNGFRFDVWDSDIGESLPDDLLLTHVFNTPAAILHNGFLSDSWNEGPALKSVMLQLQAQ